MAKLNDIKRTRINYLQFVYEKYVQHIMSEHLIIQKKLILAAKKSSENTSIIEDYLKNVSKKEKEIAKQFKNDQYETYIFIELKGDKITLYSRQYDKIYHVYLIDLDDKLLLSTLNKYNEIETVLLYIDHKYYLDVITSFPDKQRTLYNAYKLSDRIDALTK